MTWSIEFLDEAEKDMKKLGHLAQIQVISAGIDEQVYKEAAKRRDKHDL